MLACKNCTDTFKMYGVSRIIIEGTGSDCQVCAMADAAYSIPDVEFGEKCRRAAIYSVLTRACQDKTLNSPIVEKTLIKVFFGEMTPEDGLLTIIINQDGVITEMASSLDERKTEDKPES